MKLRFTYWLSQTVLTSTVVVVSLACTTSKSADSQSSAANHPTLIQTAPLSGPGQENKRCALTLSAAPAINGLRLGMNRDELLAIFPGSKDEPEVRQSLSAPPNQFGTSSFMIRPSAYENREQFAGIMQITFSFLDNRMSKMYVGFNGPKWTHVDQFVAKFVEGTTLPAVGDWEAYVGMDNQMKTLTCAEFEVRVFTGGEGGNLNYIQIQDLEADKKLKERRKKAREQASPAPSK